MNGFDEFSTEVSSLENGATLATMNIPNCYTTTIEFFVKIGEKNESEDKLGITHLTEHLWCGRFRNDKGQTLWETARGCGGRSNGETGLEHTACWITVPHQSTFDAIDSLASIAIETNFSDDEVRKEAEVIVEELSEDLDNPTAIAANEMKKVWGDSPLSRSDFLAIDILPKLSKKHVLDYYKNNYSFSNMIIAVAGRVNHIEIVDKMSQVLLKEKQAYTKLNIESSSYRRINPPEIFMGDYASLLHIATKGISRYDDRYWALECLALVLCSAELQTRLWKFLRDKGLSYGPEASACHYSDVGLFDVFVPFTDKSQYIEKEVIKQMIGMAKLNTEEIIWAKEQLKTNFLASIPESENAAMYLAESAYYLGKVLKVPEVIEQINAVNENSVEAIAKEIMRDELISVVRVSPKV
ncbi:M16 family metallopeptidase [Chloroflexota bacterium]